MAGWWGVNPLRSKGVLLVPPTGNKVTRLWLLTGHLKKLISNNRKLHIMLLWVITKQTIYKLVKSGSMVKCIQPPWSY